VANNLQLIPTPICYLGRHNVFRGLSEAAIGSASGIVSAFLDTGSSQIVSDAAASVASIVSALYIVPDTENATDAASSSATIISAAITNTFWQRNGADSAKSAAGIVSAIIFAAVTHSGVDSAGSSATIVSAIVMNSTAYALTNGMPLHVNFAHGLAAVPAYVRFVLLCTTNDLTSGINAGQEVVPNVTQAGEIIFSYGADTTKIYLNYNGAIGSAAIIEWTGNLSAITSFTNFSLKVYWQ
jgi:hypothetical protein